MKAMRAYRALIVRLSCACCACVKLRVRIHGYVVLPDVVEVFSPAMTGHGTPRFRLGHALWLAYCGCNGLESRGILKRKRQYRGVFGRVGRDHRAMVLEHHRTAIPQGPYQQGSLLGVVNLSIEVQDRDVREEWRALAPDRKYVHIGNAERRGVRRMTVEDRVEIGTTAQDGCVHIEFAHWLNRSGQLLSCVVNGADIVGGCCIERPSMRVDVAKNQYLFLAGYADAYVAFGERPDPASGQNAVYPCESYAQFVFGVSLVSHMILLHEVYRRHGVMRASARCWSGDSIGARNIPLRAR